MCSKLDAINIQKCRCKHGIEMLFERILKLISELNEWECHLSVVCNKVHKKQKQKQKLKKQNMIYNNKHQQM